MHKNLSVNLSSILDITTNVAQESLASLMIDLIAPLYHYMKSKGVHSGALIQYLWFWWFWVVTKKNHIRASPLPESS
jgi:hypothetical protein